MQSNFATLIRTLTYQLSMFDARSGAAISRVVAIHENIAGMPLSFRFATLLSANTLKSAEWSGGPILFVINTLDECRSATDHKVLMQALSTGFSDLPLFIQIMVVSRQEYDIQWALGSHLNVCPYPFNIESATNRDVLEFV
jgi:hypothetical protein